MDSAPSASDLRTNRFDGLHADAKAAIGSSANSLRTLREQYREAYHDELGRWHAIRDELERMDRAPLSAAKRDARTDPAAAVEAGAEDARRIELRRDDEHLTAMLGLHQQELAKLDLAQRTLESAWLFLERGDSSLLDAARDPSHPSDPSGPGLPGGSSGPGAPPPNDMRMRIVEAQEAERSRLAQEVHDGPAQALTNAIFQVDMVDRVLDQDPASARSELRYLRELLRRELGDVRSFITQLRPPVLDDLGLDGAIGETASNLTAITGLGVGLDLTGPPEQIGEAAQTVVLRVVQEALQNVRKHADAKHVRITTRVEDDAWVLEVRDDGRGFDIDAVGARGRRNFGLQFMRERSELIGARLEVRSRPEDGTVVLLAIPVGGEES